jgi:hypothetical protein
MRALPTLPLAPSPPRAVTRHGAAAVWLRFANSTYPLTRLQEMLG